MKPPPMPEPTVGLGVHRWAYGTKDIEARDAQWAALLADAVAQERERAVSACTAVRMDDGKAGQHLAWYAGIDACIAAIRAQTDKP